MKKKTGNKKKTLAHHKNHESMTGKNMTLCTFHMYYNKMRGIH